MTQNHDCAIQTDNSGKLTVSLPKLRTTKKSTIFRSARGDPRPVHTYKLCKLEEEELKMAMSLVLSHEQKELRNI